MKRNRESTGRPWSGARPTAWIFLFGLAATTWGCGESLKIPEGCLTDGDVPDLVTNELEASADMLVQRIRQGSWDLIYEDAALPVRERYSTGEFTTPMSQVAQELGIPPQLGTHSLTVVRFGPGFSSVSPLECEVDGQDRPRTLLLSDHPIQASLVQKGTVGPGEEMFLSTLWNREGGAWRLAAFFAKMATVQGKDWEAFVEEAKTQRAAGHARNAALLYNLAIDLLVPNAWTQPPDLATLQRKQGRMSVTDLPVNRIFEWPDPPDTHRVFSVNYTVARNQIVILFKYEAEIALADTAAQTAYSDQLFRYIQGTFPEYNEVFDAMVLQATDPRERSRTWLRVYPLKDRS